MWSLSSCQRSQCSYPTSGIRPTGNVRRGLGLWEICGHFDLDREQQFLKRQQRGTREGPTCYDYCLNEGGVEKETDWKKFNSLAYSSLIKRVKREIYESSNGVHISSL